MALPAACCAVVLCNLVKSSFYFSVHVEPYLVNEAVESLSTKYGFDLAEHRLYRVELGTVSDVKHRHDVEFMVDGPHSSRFVNIELVHEKGKWHTPMSPSKLLQIVNEVLGSYRTFENHSPFHSFFLGHGDYYTSVACVDLPLVNGQVRVFATPVFALHRKLSEVDLVQVHQSVILPPQPGNL